MQKETYEKRPKARKVEPGDIISFYFPAKGSIEETDLVAETIFETMTMGQKIMMVRASKRDANKKGLEMFKGKVQFDKSASYDLDYVTIQEKASPK